MNIEAPKQIRTVDRMIKRGFAVDYMARRGFNPCVYMSRVVSGIKRYAQVTVDGMVNGRQEAVFV